MNRLSGRFSAGPVHLRSTETIRALQWSPICLLVFTHFPPGDQLYLENYPRIRHMTSSLVSYQSEQLRPPHRCDVSGQLAKVAPCLESLRFPTSLPEGIQNKGSGRRWTFESTSAQSTLDSPDILLAPALEVDTAEWTRVLGS